MKKCRQLENTYFTSSCLSHCGTEYGELPIKKAVKLRNVVENGMVKAVSLTILNDQIQEDNELFGMWKQEGYVTQ